MAAVNVEGGDPVAGVVMINPSTGEPISKFGPESLSLESALMLFATKEQMNQALAEASAKSVPDFALYAPADYGGAEVYYYGQPIRQKIVKAMSGDSIVSDGTAITLKGGKTYKLTAALACLYPWMAGGFAWAEENNRMQPIGVMGGTNGAPYNWNSQSQAIAIVTPQADTRYLLMNMNPFSELQICGGFNYWQTPAGSWMSVEVMN